MTPISLYPTNRPSGFLNDSIYANVHGALRIIAVDSLNPFTLKIEVVTNRFLAIGPCKDVSIICRDLDGNVLATTTVRTSTFSGCSGQSRLVFKSGFVPTIPVTFQVLGGTNPDTLAEWWTDSYMSNPIQLSQGNAIISKPKSERSFFAAPAGQALTTMTKSITTLAIIGVGGYFLLPFLPAISKASTAASNKISEKIK